MPTQNNLPPVPAENPDGYCDAQQSQFAEQLLRIDPTKRFKGIALNLARFADLTGGRELFYCISGMREGQDDLSPASRFTVSYDPSEGFDVVYHKEGESIGVEFVIDDSGSISYFNDDVDLSDEGPIIHNPLLELIVTRAPDSDHQGYIRTSVNCLVAELTRCGVKERISAPGETGRGLD